MQEKIEVMRLELSGDVRKEDDGYSDHWCNYSDEESWVGEKRSKCKRTVVNVHICWEEQRRRQYRLSMIMVRNVRGQLWGKGKWNALVPNSNNKSFNEEKPKLALMLNIFYGRLVLSIYINNPYWILVDHLLYMTGDPETQLWWLLVIISEECW